MYRPLDRGIFYIIRLSYVKSFFLSIINVSSFTKNINTAANSDFLSAFIRAAAGTNEANSLVTKNGTLSAEGMARIQNALFELAYHDQTLTEQFSEGDESPLRNVIRAMMNVAPVAAQISEGIKAGDFYGVDFAEDIVEAEKFLKDLKQNPKYENETRKASEHYELYINEKRKEAANLRRKITELQSDDEYSRLYNDLLSIDFSTDEFSEAVKQLRAYSDKIGLTEKAERAEALEEELRKNRSELEEAEKVIASNKEQNAVRESGLSEADYFRKQALKEFGTTPYFYDAGYILPDGKMLNLSGEKGRHFGSRGQDHRTVGTIYEATTGSEAMLRFMSDGNIRIMAESPGLDIISTVAPTTAQYSKIRDFIRQYAKEEYFNIDFTDERGNTVDNLEYEGNISPTRIINDIKAYYETGEAKAESLVSQFHRMYSRKETKYAPRSLDEITADEYNKRSWAYHNGVLDENAMSVFGSALSDIKNGYHYPKAWNGKYLIPVGSKDGVHNQIVITDGKHNDASIEAIITLDLENETEIAPDRNMIAKLLEDKEEKYTYEDALEIGSGAFGQGVFRIDRREDFENLRTLRGQRRDSGKADSADRSLQNGARGVSEGQSILSNTRINDEAPDDGAFSSPVSQEVSSAGTSIKQIPALFTNKNVVFGDTNIDIGGGRYDLATNYLAERGTTNLLFDPYNQSKEVNKATLDYLMEGNKADTVTCANVLNVMDERCAGCRTDIRGHKGRGFLRGRFCRGYR